jgi:hypothetical protein
MRQNYDGLSAAIELEPLRQTDREAPSFPNPRKMASWLNLFYNSGNENSYTGLGASAVQQPIQGRPNERQLEVLAMVKGWANKKRWEDKVEAMRADRSMAQQQHWKTQMGLTDEGRKSGKNKMWGEIDEDDDLGHEVIFYREWKQKKHYNFVSGIEKSLKMLRSVVLFMIFIILWCILDSMVDVDGLPIPPESEGSIVVTMPRQKVWWLKSSLVPVFSMFFLVLQVRLLLQFLYFIMKFLFWEIPEKLLGQDTSVIDKMFRHNPVVKPIVEAIVKAANYLGPCKHHLLAGRVLWYFLVTVVLLFWFFICPCWQMYSPIDKLPKVKWTSKRLWFMSQVHPSESEIKSKDYWTFTDEEENLDAVRPILVARRNFCYHCCGIKIAVALYNSCFRCCVKVSRVLRTFPCSPYPPHSLLNASPIVIQRLRVRERLVLVSSSRRIQAQAVRVLPAQDLAARSDICCDGWRCRLTVHPHPVRGLHQRPRLHLES